MSLALTRKELRAHAGILVAAFVLSALALVGDASLSAERGGRFVALVRMAMTAGVMNAMVAANRLFVLEYAGRTQLFLEVLPIGRARVFVTKWLLGAAWLALLTCCGWLYTWLRQRQHEVIALADALPVLHAVGSFMLAVWSFAAMAGMLGRHRYTAWIAAGLLTAVALDAGGLATDELPLARLLGEQVRMARAPVPWSALAQAWAIAGVCAAAAASLALIGSGAMASVLAKRMTARERVFMLVVGFSAAFLFQTLSDKREKPGFALAAAQTAPSKYAHVGVLQTADFDVAHARELAAVIASDVDGLIEVLALQLRPSIFVLPQRGLDREVIERAELPKNSGIVLRSAPGAPRDRLRASVLAHVLEDATRGRGAKEDRRVLLEGFAGWWALADDAAARERWWLRAASGRLPITPAALTRWLETREQLGECVAMSYAFATLDVLAAQLGRTRLLELMRGLWQTPHDDVRALLEIPPATRLERAGWPWAGLAQRTETARQTAQARHAAQLTRRPALHAELHVEHSAARGATLESRLDGGAGYYVLYGELGPWTRSAEHLARFDVHGSHATVPTSLRPASRILAVVEAEDPVLDCPVRLAAERITLP